MFTRKGISKDDHDNLLEKPTGQWYKLNKVSASFPVKLGPLILDDVAVEDDIQTTTGAGIIVVMDDQPTEQQQTTDNVDTANVNNNNNVIPTTTTNVDVDTPTKQPEESKDDASVVVLDKRQQLLEQKARIERLLAEYNGDDVTVATTKTRQSENRLVRVISDDMDEVGMQGNMLTTTVATALETTSKSMEKSVNKSAAISGEFIDYLMQRVRSKVNKVEQHELVLAGLKQYNDTADGTRSYVHKCTKESYDAMRYLQKQMKLTKIDHDVTFQDIVTDPTATFAAAAGPVLFTRDENEARKAAEKLFKVTETNMGYETAPIICAHPEFGKCSEMVENTGTYAREISEYVENQHLKDFLQSFEHFGSDVLRNLNDMKFDEIFESQKKATTTTSTTDVLRKRSLPKLMPVAEEDTASVVPSAVSASDSSVSNKNDSESSLSKVVTNVEDNVDKPVELVVAQLQLPNVLSSKEDEEELDQIVQNATLKSSASTLEQKKTRKPLFRRAAAVNNNAQANNGKNKKGFFRKLFSRSGGGGNKNAAPVAKNSKATTSTAQAKPAPAPIKMTAIAADTSTRSSLASTPTVSPALTVAKASVTNKDNISVSDSTAAVAAEKLKPTKSILLTKESAKIIHKPVSAVPPVSTKKVESKMKPTSPPQKPSKAPARNAYRGPVDIDDVSVSTMSIQAAKRIIAPTKAQRIWTEDELTEVKPVDLDMSWDDTDTDTDASYSVKRDWSALANDAKRGDLAEHLTRELLLFSRELAACSDL